MIQFDDFIGFDPEQKRPLPTKRTAILSISAADFETAFPLPEGMHVVEFRQCIHSSPLTIHLKLIDDGEKLPLVAEGDVIPPITLDELLAMRDPPRDPVTEFFFGKR